MTVRSHRSEATHARGGSIHERSWMPPSKDQRIRDIKAESDIDARKHQSRENAGDMTIHRAPPFDRSIALNESVWLRSRSRSEIDRSIRNRNSRTRIGISFGGIASSNQPDVMMALSFGPS